MKARLTVFIAAVAACAALAAWRLSSGVATDLYSLAGSGGGALSEIAKGTSGSIRVLCADEPRAEKCRAAFRFDEPVDFQSVLEYYRTHGDGLLAAKSRGLLEKGEADRIRRSAKRRDFSGIGLFPKADDPFYLLSDFVAELKSLMPQGASDGSVLLTANIAGSPDRETAAGLARLIDLARHDDGIYLSGAPFHTFIATEKTKREINILGALSLLFVIVLGFMLFRSAKFIIPTVLSLSSAFIVGAAAVSAMPGKPHALTFLFGTSLIGLGVDYCYHALSATDESRRDFTKRLSGALATTVFAFAPLLFSHISILRQMSVFTTAGLVAVYLCAVIFLRGMKIGMASKAGPACFPPIPLVVFFVAVVVASYFGTVKFLTNMTYDPDAFHTPDAVMARGEAKLASFLGNSGGTFAVVEGATLQEALEREEELGINGLSRLTPSLKRQRENFALKSAFAPSDAGSAAENPSFVEGVPPPLESVVSAMLVRGGDRVYLLSPFDKATFRHRDWCRRFNPRAELEKLFQSLTAEILRLFTYSYAAMTLVLLVIFRRKFLLYVLPLAGATFATNGTLGYIGEPNTFFHVVCFLMIWGMGIDYSIFIRGGNGGAARRTVLFCLLSSVAGFGLLSFTSFHIISAMGRTLSIGLVFCYLFALWTPRPREKKCGADTAGDGWSGQKEQSAGKCRILFMWWIYRLFGKGAAKAAFLPVFLFIYPFCVPARKALRAYYSVVNAERRRRGLHPLGCIGWRMFMQTLGFAWTMFDKTDACTLCRNPPRFTVTGDLGWMSGGAFLVSTHLGCIEVLPALARDDGWRAQAKGGRVPRVHAFQQLGHDAIFTSVFLSRLDRSLFELHAVEDIGVETAVEMKDAIGRGDMVLMAGDRLSASAGSRRQAGAAPKRRASFTRKFLGVDCEWPKGTFRFAGLMDCPVYAIVCVRTGWNSYEVVARRLGESLLDDYVSFLEEQTMLRPEQWYQFYGFFRGVSDERD